MSMCKWYTHTLNIIILIKEKIKIEYKKNNVGYEKVQYY